MAGEWILAIDQGTTNTKAVLVDRDGRDCLSRIGAGWKFCSRSPAGSSRIRWRCGSRWCR